MYRELTLVVLFTSGCTVHRTSSPSAAAQEGEAAEPVAGCVGGASSSSVIMAAEFRRDRASDLYEAIRRLRPAFLATRGVTSIDNGPAAAMVLIEDRRVIGGVGELRGMGVRDISCIRRLSATDVYQIIGVSVADGGIEVVH